MSYGITDSQYYTDIATAIRTRCRNQSTYLPSEMATAIENIPNETIVPVITDLDTGYVTNGKWVLGGTTVSYSDVYEIQAGRSYFLSLDNTVGTRFRAMISSTSPIGATSDITGTQVINQNNPATYASVSFVASSDGYLTVQKDNAGHANLRSYLFDLKTLVDRA